jgi:signal transduction histidine kinase/ABC-type amino acid transport substrate-binding protein/CheY-like chemotaxis protein
MIRRIDLNYNLWKNYVIIKQDISESKGNSSGEVFMNHKKLKLIILFIILLISKSAAAQEHTSEDTLVISISRTFSPLTFINSEGKPAGLFVDMWKLWSEKTGRKIEFLPSTWNETIENLKSGAAHIHSGLAITPEREKQMIFSQPLYENTFYLFFPLKQGKALTLRELSGQRVGVVQNSSQEEFLKKHHPDIELVLFKSTEEAIISTKDGKVRAVADSYLSTSSDIMRLGLSGEFEAGKEILYARKFHAGILKENTELQSLVNKGFDAISNQEMAEIESRWIPDSSKRYYKPDSPKIRLTPEEEAWSRSHRTVRFGFMDGFPPISFSEDNEYRGIHTDYLRLISERTGIRFEYVPVSPAELDMRAKAREFDMFPSFNVSERRVYADFTNPLMEYKSVIITRSDETFISGVSTLKGKKVTVVKGIRFYKLLFDKYPEIRLIEKKNIPEALEAVSKSEADAYVGSAIIACWLIQKNHLINLRIAGVADHPPEYLMYAIRNDYPELLGIINKGIASVSKEEHEAILQKWFTVQVEHKPNWDEFLRWFLGIGSVFTIILGVSLYWNRRLAKEIAERKRAEEASRESERVKSEILDKLNEAQQIAMIGSWEWNLQTDKVWWSDETYRIFGVMPEKYTPSIEENTKFIHPDDLENYLKLFNYSLETGVPLNYQLRLVSEEDKIKNCYAKGRVIYGDSGKPIRFAGTIMDITARKQAKENLKKIQSLLNETGRMAKVGGWEFDVETLRQTWTEEVYRIHEVGTDYMPTVSDGIEFYEAQSRPIIEKAVLRAIDYGESFNLELRFITAKGHHKWVHAIGHAHQENGRTVKVSGTFQDITERKRTEEELRKNRELLNETGRMAKVGGWEIDMATRELTWTEEVYRIHEVSADYRPTVEKALGFYHPDSLPIISKAVQNAIEYGEPFDSELKFITAKGNHRWVHDIGRAYRKGGKIIRVGGTFQDITEKKHIETELIRAKEAAEAANLAKSAFLANMTHELRTPLNAVLGYAQFLQKDPSVTETQKERLKIIQKSGDHLLSLINDILDISKIESGRIEIGCGDFQLHDFLNNIASMFQIRAEQKDIGFHYEASSQLPDYVRGDEIRIRQILINILGNAVKFTEKGSVTFRADHKNGRIYFEIKDTGPGIEVHELEKIFEPFHQTGSYLKKNEGTGLGLSISRKLAELMGGSLTAQSRPGEGAVFRVELELLPVCSAENIPLPESSSDIIDYTGMRRKVLIVDDIELNRLLLSDLLIPLGFAVYEADNGQNAVETAKELKPDLILMDLLMPGLDGFGATRQIRAFSPPIQTVILAISAGVFENHILKSREAGCDDFISKPVVLGQLLAKMQQHLKLEWIYRKTEAVAEAKVPIIPPCPEDLELLANSARMGDVQSIRNKAEALMQKDKQLVPFAEELIRLAKSFQMGKIRTFLEKSAK